MRYLKQKRAWVLALALMCVASLAFAQYAMVVRQNQLFLAGVECSGAVDLSGTVTTTGMETITWTAATLTSPTVTFSAAGVSYVSLTSDANLTGVYPIGGVLNQVLWIKSGAGSNTMRLDDSASSMTIGANVTLTEAQNDYIVLECTKAPDEWAAMAAHDN